MNRFVIKTALVLFFIIFCSARINTQLADTTIVRLIQEKRVPVLGLGFIDKGKVALSKVFGNLNPGVPAPINTVFNVASITKTITAMVSLSLVNAGKWDLDKPIYYYWTDPDIAGNS